MSRRVYRDFSLSYCFSFYQSSEARSYFPRKLCYWNSPLTTLGYRITWVCKVRVDHTNLYMLWFWSHGRSISFNLNADLKVNNWETSFIKEDYSIEISNSPVHVYNIYIIKPFLGDPKLLNLETLCILPFQDSWEQ